jgi:hypothetical protein
MVQMNRGVDPTAIRLGQSYLLDDPFQYFMYRRRILCTLHIAVDF